MPEFDEAMKTYLFTQAPITEIEAGAAGGVAAGGPRLSIGSLR
jgi:hypothetical protein